MLIDIKTVFMSNFIQLMGPCWDHDESCFTLIYCLTLGNVYIYIIMYIYIY